MRDFDLQKRLFRYPLSYLIYSAQFDALPDPVRDRVYQRLFEVLTGKDKTPDQQAAFEIVRATKPNLPKYWR